MSEPLIQVTFLTGELKLKPVEYRLVKKIIKSKWVSFFNYVEYYIETDFMKLGPFKTKDEAYGLSCMGGGIILKDCTGEV